MTQSSVSLPHPEDDDGGFEDEVDLDAEVDDEMEGDEHGDE